MSDHHTLITQLCDELDHNRRCLLDDRQVTHPLADRARAALAADGPAVPEGREPAAVVEQPSDKELNALWNCSGIADEHGNHTGNIFEFARAVLSRWGHQPAPLPAEGEVGELVEFLRIYGDEVMDEYGDVGEHDQLTRAADLLEQRHPTPVPVSERLPGPEDCDGEGRCWAWRSFDPEEDDSGDCWMTIPCEWLEGSERWTHWLPAHALPLPAGEYNQGENNV